MIPPTYFEELFAIGVGQLDEFDIIVFQGMVVAFLCPYLSLKDANGDPLLPPPANAAMAAVLLAEQLHELGEHMTPIVRAWGRITEYFLVQAQFAQIVIEDS